MKISNILRLLPVSRPAPYSSLPRRALLLLLLLAFLACNHNDRPDIASISIPDVHIERFDTAFFSLDSNHIEQGLYQLAQRYPYFTGDFVGNILGAGPLSDTSRLAFLATHQFLTSYLPVRDSLEKKYPRLD